MKQKNEFWQSCGIALAGGVLFIVGALCVAFFVPRIVEAEHPETVLLEPAVAEHAVAVSLLDDVATIALLPTEDEALLLYRNPSARLAVEWFYTNVAGNKQIASAILTEADRHNIAPSLAFALAYTESRYNAAAVNHNRNKTIDRGLFQLNSGSFPKLTEAEFFDPEISAQYGMAHLRFCLDAAHGNEISALAMYNAGTNKVRANNTPQTTLNYIGHIMETQEKINRLFSERVLAYYDTRPLISGVTVAYLQK